MGMGFLCGVMENVGQLCEGCTTLDYNKTRWMVPFTLVDFPGGAVVKNLPANAGNTGSSPGLGRSHMLRSN